MTKSNVVAKLDLGKVEKHLKRLPAEVSDQMFKIRDGKLIVTFKRLGTLKVGNCRCPLLMNPEVALHKLGVKKSDQDRGAIKKALEAIIAEAKDSLVRTDCGNYDHCRQAFLKLAIKNKEVFAASCDHCRKRPFNHFPIGLLGSRSADGSGDSDGPGQARVISGRRSSTFKR